MDGYIWICKRVNCPNSDIGKIDIASDSIVVPSVHGVDGLTDLLATLLFDAACIDPEEMNTVS